MPFNPDISKHCSDVCPPVEAKPVKCELFRGIPELPMTEEHFMAHPEVGKPCNPKKCTHWGLSVWTHEDDALHALELFPSMENWRIARGTVSHNDGVLLGTPNKRQPEHHTFWKSFGLSIVGKFSLVPKAT